MFASWKDRLSALQHQQQQGQQQGQQQEEKDSTAGVDSHSGAAASLTNSWRRSLQLSPHKTSFDVKRSSADLDHDSLTLDPANEKIDGNVDASSASDSSDLPPEVNDKLRMLESYQSRFPDLVKAYKKLLAEKQAIESVVKETTPLEGISDVDAFEAHIRNLTVKSEISRQEIKRLTQEQDDQQRQLVKLREIHKIETTSQSDMIGGLQQKLHDREEEINRLKIILDKLTHGHTEDAVSSEDSKTNDIIFHDGHDVDVNQIAQEYEEKLKRLQTKLDAIMHQGQAQLPPLPYPPPNDDDNATEFQSLQIPPLATTPDYLTDGEEETKQQQTALQQFQQAFDSRILENESSQVAALTDMAERIDSLIQEIEVYRGKADLLGQEKQQLEAEWKAKDDELREMKAKHKKEVDAYEERLNLRGEEMEAALAGWEMNLNSLEKEKRELMEDRERAWHNVETYKTQLEENQVSLEKRFTGHVDASIDGAATSDDLRVHVKELEAEVEALAQDPSKNKLKKLRQEKNRAETRATELELQVQSLKAQMEISDGKPVITPAQENGDMSAKIIQLEQEVRQLCEERDRLEHHVVGLTANHNDSAAQTESVAIRSSSNDTEMNELRATLKKTTKELQTSIDAISRLNKDLEILQSDNTQLSTARTEALEKLWEAQERVTVLTNKERDLQESLAVAKATINQRDQDMEALTKQQADEEEKRNKTLMLLKGTKKQILSLQKEKQDLAEELERTKKGHEEAERVLNQEVTKLTSHIADYTGDVAKLQTLNAKLAQEKESLFDQLQLKQAEFESSQSMLETLQRKITEFDLQVQETGNRASMLDEELTMSKRLFGEKCRENDVLKVKMSEMEHLLEESETLKRSIEAYKSNQNKLEVEIKDVRKNATREMEKLKTELEEREKDLNAARDELHTGTIKMKEYVEANNQMRHRLVELDEQVMVLKKEMMEKELELETIRETKETLNHDKQEHERLIEEARMRESHIRAVNKTLKEEIRKLQKSTHPQAPSPTPQAQGIRSRESTPPSTPTSVHYMATHKEEEVNLEYLRHVILKFVEYKERRPQLVPVLATLLKFSPEEVRRLNARA